MKVNLIKHIAKYKDQFLLIFILLTLISCTVMNDMSSKNKVINTLERISLNYYKIDKLLLVNVEDQEMYLLQKGIITAFGVYLKKKEMCSHTIRE